METGRSHDCFVFPESYLPWVAFTVESHLATKEHTGKHCSLALLVPASYFFSSTWAHDKPGLYFFQVCIQRKLGVVATWSHSAFFQSFQIQQTPIFHRVNHDVGLNLFTHVWIHDFTTPEVNLNISTPLTSMHSSVVGDERKEEKLSASKRP